MVGTPILVRLPARSPSLNAHDERFVLSVKSECLDRSILLGERHPRRAVAESVRRCHGERHHPGLAGAAIAPDASVGRTEGRVACRERLGGMLGDHDRTAA